MTTILPRPLRGIIPPMITPLLDPDTLDSESTVRQVERMIAGGVSGLFLLGTTGEAPGLSYRLRRELVELVCRQAKSRVPVLVSITDTSYVESLAAARHAADTGASGLVVAPPYYYGMSQPELLWYLSKLITQLPLPVYLYNIPNHTRTPIHPETVRDLSHLPNLFGIKDSSGDIGTLRRMVRLLANRMDFSVLCGPEEILAEAIRLGAHGGIAGGSNLAPRFYVELYRSAYSGNQTRTEELQSIVAEVSRRIYNVVPGESTYLRGMKCAISCLGHCRYVMAEPYLPFPDDVKSQIETALKEISTRAHNEFL